ncbi:MAG TPA: TetR/AcrR family transcriptional regulator [Symbiobacteriaceae bacterium]|nr:TetR/AcrR family transcriptional regulator [Symbiobacteriaceae bacterium]
MAPRPKNPPPDRRQEILEAALRIYAEKGYTATTNADIAREAGVTPAALYYYFPSKADLFRAAITGRRSAIADQVSQMSDQILEMPPDVVLPFVFQAMAAFLADERTLAIMRIVLSEGPRNPEVMEVYQKDVVGQMSPYVMKYIQHQMELGRIPEGDPRLTMVLLASPMLVMVILRDILKLDIVQGLSTEAVVRGIIEKTLPALLAPPQNKE